MHLIVPEKSVPVFPSSSALQLSYADEVEALGEARFFFRPSLSFRLQ